MAHTLWGRLIGFGFRLLYNELAWTYDAVSWVVSFGEWRRWQRSALPEVRGPRVLEVGHGPGHLLASLESAGRLVFGLDVSPYMGRLAKKRSGAPLVRGRVQELPFRAGAFDSVISTFPTEYILRPDSLAAIHRVLVADGALVIVPEGHLTGNSPLHRFIEWLFKITGQRDDVFVLGTEEGEIQVHPWELFSGILAHAGFQARREAHTLKRSAVTVVVATKVAVATKATQKVAGT